MICADCIRRVGLWADSDPQPNRCLWCGQLHRECFSKARVKTDDPREVIKERVVAIKGRLTELQHFVDEYTALTIERLSLLENHRRLEHILTSVQVQKIAPADVTHRREKEQRRAQIRRVIPSLSDEERRLLIAVLKGEIS